MIYTHKDITLDTVSLEVTKGGKFVKLSKMQYFLLEYLLKAGKIRTNEMILNKLNISSIYSLRVIINQLQKKTGKIITNYRGVGYVIK